MNLFKAKKYPWEEDEEDEENGIENPANWSVRQELERQFDNPNLDYPIKGIVDNFDITDTGLLAASHREGAGAVHNYLSHLEKAQDGRYYIDYDKIQDPKMREMFKRIETRLRRFAK